MRGSRTWSSRPWRSAPAQDESASPPPTRSSLAASQSGLHHVRRRKRVRLEQLALHRGIGSPVDARRRWHRRRGRSPVQDDLSTSTAPSSCHRDGVCAVDVLGPRSRPRCCRTPASLPTPAVRRRPCHVDVAGRDRRGDAVRRQRVETWRRCTVVHAWPAPVPRAPARASAPRQVVREACQERTATRASRAVDRSRAVADVAVNVRAVPRGQSAVRDRVASEDGRQPRSGSRRPTACLQLSTPIATPGWR